MRAARGDGGAANPAERAVLAGLFALVFALCAYFYNGYGWNQTARYDAIWAFVEPGPNRGTVRIDDFLTDPVAGLNTGDWAHNPEHAEHYYANKAPGTTLLGIPFYFALYHGERLLGVDPVSVRSVLVNAYLIHLWVTVLPVALSSLLFFGLLRHLGRSATESLWLTLLLYAGTLLWPFSTMLWGHTTAAAFVVAASWCFVTGGRRRWLAAGLFAGAAVLTDYGAVPFALSLVVAAAVVRDHRPAVAPLVLGGLAPLVVFGAYHWTLFGSPLTLASSYSQAEMIGEGDFLGLFRGPAWRAVWGLTLSPVRGLFFFMPALALGFLALRRPPDGRRPLVWLALANVVAAFAMNLSFNAWQGGITTGPRYQIVALPFWVLLVALALQGRPVAPAPSGRRMVRAAVTLGAVAVANMAAIATVSPMAPDAFRGSPLLFVWAKLLGVLRVDLGLAPPSAPGGPLSRGSLHIYPGTPMRDWPIPLDDPLIADWAAFNLGERVFGLDGTLSLLPLVALAGALAWWAARSARRADAAAAD